MASRLSFPRQRRIRKRREYLLVQGRGRRISGRNYLFFVRPRVDLPLGGVATPARFGITVTRKVGNAVARNRIKRIVREGCRHLASKFPVGLDLVVVARPSAVDVNFRTFCGELTDLLSRLGSVVRR